ncbi:MAG: hypothetical protein H7222_12945 [Methylotenera sp.]|nr:hypothetical protein [Oligoflexia bacterium]
MKIIRASFLLSSITLCLLQLGASPAIFAHEVPRDAPHPLVKASESGERVIQREHLKALKVQLTELLHEKSELTDQLRQSRAKSDIAASKTHSAELERVDEGIDQLRFDAGQPAAPLSKLEQSEISAFIAAGGGSDSSHSGATSAERAPATKASKKSVASELHTHGH